MFQYIICQGLEGCDGAHNISDDIIVGGIDQQDQRCDTWAGHHETSRMCADSKREEVCIQRGSLHMGHEHLERDYILMIPKLRPSWKPNHRLLYQKLRASLAWLSIVPTLSQTLHQWRICCGSWPVATSPLSGVVNKRKPLIKLRHWSQGPWRELRVYLTYIENDNHLLVVIDYYSNGAKLLWSRIQQHPKRYS